MSDVSMSQSNTPSGTPFNDLLVSISKDPDLSNQLLQAVLDVFQDYNVSQMQVQALVSGDYNVIEPLWELEQCKEGKAVAAGHAPWPLSSWGT